jgi:ElaA protein
MPSQLHIGHAQHRRLLSQMHFITKPFNELTIQQLYSLYELRARIFIVEQQCPYQDVDEKDLVSIHVMLLEGEKLIGYSRIIPPGISYSEPSIGRVAIDKNYRGRELGKELMLHTIKMTLELYRATDIVISAQCYLENFYSELGFRSEGNQYLEDDIPHIKMRMVNPGSS